VPVIERTNPRHRGTAVRCRIRHSPGAAVQIRRLSAPLGAVVEGIDVKRVDAAAHAELNALFCQHHVLVFPEQQLTPDEQLAFGRRWGTLLEHPYAGLPEHPQIIELHNKGKARDFNQHWHSDMTYNAAPPKLTMLYAHAAPEFGGDTAFSNQHLAYEELSSGLKQTLDGLRALHSAKGLARLYGAEPSEAPRAEHPVVRTHDETGRRALYVCRAFTEQFSTWSRQESRALLEYLFEHSVRPEFQARHHWRAGDLVMWDNRCLLHFAVHDHGDAPRLIHRLQVAGPIPQ
jgi:alpha-ketoglutarate-dependent taurine dioxygenase